MFCPRCQGRVRAAAEGADGADDLERSQGGGEHPGRPDEAGLREGGVRHRDDVRRRRRPARYGGVGQGGVTPEGGRVRAPAVE